jgi:predicted AAA+ superfamily ATPase
MIIGNVDIKRFAEKSVLSSLKTSRIVEVIGSRQVGKSTLVRKIANLKNGKYISLDDEQARDFAKNDPKSFVRQNQGELLVIDEIQLAPQLINELKLYVDEYNEYGKFLITGSANLANLSFLHESLAGRAQIIDLYGFSQDEKNGIASLFIEKVFSESLNLDYKSQISKNDYFNLLQIGSYPEVQTMDEKNRQRWFRSFLRLIFNRDAKNISDLKRTADLPRILRYLASITGKELVVDNMSRDLSIPRTTLDPYIELLETLFLVKRIDAWSHNITAEVVKNRKTIILDSGLASYLTKNKDIGGLFETFCVSEIQKQISYQDDEIELFHFRDYKKNEVDLVIENYDQDKIVTFEFKYSSTVKQSDADVIKKIRDKYSEKFLYGFVVNTSDTITKMGDRIYSLPASYIWD